MTTRRTLIRTLGVGFATSAAAGTVTAKGRGGANGKQPFHQQLRKVKRATSRFEALDQALEEGYHISGPYVPGMGWHMTNPDYVEKAAKQGPSLVEPPVLTYNLDLELGAVEYAVPIPEGHGDYDHHSFDFFNDEESDHHPHHGPTEEERLGYEGRFRLNRCLLG